MSFIGSPGVGATVEISEMESLAKGSTIVGDGTGAPSILAVGTNGQTLIADSAEATGTKWATPTPTAHAIGGSQHIADTLTNLNSKVSDNNLFGRDGVAGGQTLIGGTAASENLTLQSTSNAARGNLIFLDDVVLGTGEGGIVAANGKFLRAPDIVTGGAGNIAGANFTIAPGLGTGIGAVGILDFQLPIVAAAGDNIQTLASRLTLDMAASTTVLTMAAAQALTISTTSGDLTLNPSGNTVVSSGELEMNDAIHWNTDVAVTPTRAEITRDASDLHYNVSTGNVHSWRINNVVEMELSSVSLNLGSNTLLNIGNAGNDFGATQLDLAASYTILGANGLTVSTTAGDLTLNPAGEVIIPNASGLVVGHTAQVTAGNASELQVLGTGGADTTILVGRWSANASTAKIDFVKSRNSTIGSNTIVADNDTVGKLRFFPDDGVDFATLAADFGAEVDDATPAAGDIGMAFVWQQMPGGGGAIAETMRLTASGSLGVGGTPVASAIADFVSTVKGFRPPGGTSTQRDAISSPAESLLFYDFTNNKLDFFNGTAWKAFLSTPAMTLAIGSIPFAVGGHELDDDSGLTWDNTGKVFTANLIRGPSGNPSAPTYSFTGDTDTGMYLASSGEISIAAAGVDVWAFFSGASQSDFPFRGTNGSAAAPMWSYQLDSDSGAYRIGANIIGWATGGVERARLDAAGNFILATGELEVNDAIHFDTGVAVTAARYEIIRNADATNRLQFNVPTGALMEWSVNDSPMLILNAGNGFFNLTNNALRFGDDSAITAAQAQIARVASDFHYNVSTGNFHSLRINDVEQVQISLNTLALAGGTSNQLLSVQTTGTAGVSELRLITPASSTSTAASRVVFREGIGDGSANNMEYLIGYDASNNRMRFLSRDSDGSSTDADIWRIPDGQTSIDANTTWDDNIFDDYDDVALIAASISPTARSYDFGQGVMRRGRDALIEVGILNKYEDGWVGYNDQRMAALLAGGIYQTRSRLDSIEEGLRLQVSRLEEKVSRLEALKFCNRTNKTV